MVSKVIGGKKEKGKIETLCLEDCSSDKATLWTDLYVRLGHWLRYLPSCYFAELTLWGILSQSDRNVMAGPESAKKKELVTLLANLVRHLIEGVINGQQWRHNSEVFFCSAGWLTTWGEQERFWTLSMNEERGKKSPLWELIGPRPNPTWRLSSISPKREGKKILISKLVVS